MNNLMMILFVVFGSVVFGFYFCLPKKHRHWVLLVSSIVLYAVYSKFMTIFVVITAVSIYLAGLWMNKLEDRCTAEREGKEKEEKKAIKAKYKTKKLLVLWLFVLLNVAIMFSLKYYGVVGSVYSGILSWFNVSKTLPIMKVALPLGLSYYTLSSIGYMVDVERGKYRGERNFFKVALFVCYFPQMLEGPFANFDKLAPQLHEGHEFDVRRVAKGLLLAGWGLVKILVIANRFAIISDAIFKGYTGFGGLAVVFGALAYVVKLYAEFSGCIDVARGVSEMFGIELAKNFDTPFFSQSVNEFWRRWHISLGAWFREYVFYSITMSKGMTNLNKKLHGKVNTFFEMFIPSAIALFVVWVLNGLWHGDAMGAGAGARTLKYLTYGMYWYVIMLFGMCIEPLFNLIYKKMGVDKNNKVSKCLRVFRTFLLVVVGFMLFKSKTLTDFGGMFAQIFKGGQNELVGAGVIDVADLVWCFIGLAALVVVDVLLELKIDIREKLTSKEGISFAVLLLMFIVLLVFGAYGKGYVAPDPEYGAF